MAEADEDDDGVIAYSEFVDVMVNIVIMSKALQRVADQKKVASKQSTDMIKGIRKEEVEEQMRKMFHEYDIDGNGHLDRKELKAVLGSGALGLSRREMNALMSEVDMDGDGMCSYDEFLPLCFKILKDREEEDCSSQLKERDTVYQMLIDKFQSLDLEGDGR
jgi:Ca2+-binding EF-hand superfamily protein